MSVLLALLACGMLGGDGPMRGEAALRVELEGSGPTAATDGPILVTRLEKLGATATSTAPSPDRISLAITQIRDGQALQLAIRPNRLEVAFPDGQTLTSADIASAEAAPDEMTGQPRVNATFTDAGGRRFCELTRAAVGKPIPIRVDGVELSAPIVREPICGGRMSVMMGGASTNAMDEAHALAVALGTPVLGSDWILAVIE
ncbi:MAG: hypothetical protein R3F61_17855 [Myxococcota bacterium]